MKITESMILKVCPSYPKDRLSEDVRVLNDWSERFGISTPMRMAHFLAQCAHESMGFTRLTENLNYSAKRLMQVFPKHFNPAQAYLYAGNPMKIANRIYANRMGNGSESSGDGWRYRGRGYIQLTGMANYSAYQKSGFCVGDLLSNPDWLTSSPGRMKSSMWYWYSHKCNTLADRDDIRSITKRINGGLNGLKERTDYLVKFKKILK